jgi:hypothetical protein
MENMINSIKGGELALRKLGGVLSFSLLFHLLFFVFLPILGFYGSLILDDNFLACLGFLSVSCASFDFKSEIQTLCILSCQYTHQGGD